MPIPKPTAGQNPDEYIGICMHAQANDNIPQTQKLAICYSILRRMHEDFTRIFGNFIQFFGEQEGPELYNSFVKLNGLDETKPYSPADQLKESFEWTEPRIKYWKRQEDAKYYKLFLLAANVSMNENDYTNLEDMKYASSNLAWRPLDIDHNDSWVLPFPNNRLETAFFDQQKNVIEAVIRISDNAVTPDTKESVQELIEKQEIVHPSIYALPICGVHSELADGGKVLNVPTCGYEFQRVALLRKEHQLPGDPLSRIFPLPLNESMANSLVESLNSKSNFVAKKETFGVYNKNLSERRENEMTNEQTVNDKEVEEQFTDLPDSEFACIVGTGDNKIRKLPIPDAAHCQNAMARFNQAEGCQTAEVKAKICRAARKFNIDNAFEKGGFCATAESVGATEELLTVQTENTKLQAENAKLKLEREQATEELIDAKKKISELAEKYADATSETTIHQKRIETLEANVSALDKVHMEDKITISGLEKKNESKDKTISDYKESIQKLKQSSGEQEIALNESKGQIAQKDIDTKEKDEEIEKLRTANKRSTEALSTEKIANQSLRDKLNDESSERSKANTELKNKSQELIEARQENTNLNSDIETQRQDNSKLSTQNYEFSRKLLAKQREIDELKESYEKRINEKEDGINKNLDEIKVERQKHKNDINELTEKLKQQDATLKRVRREARKIINAFKGEGYKFENIDELLQD